MDLALWGAFASGGATLAYFVLNAWRSDARRTRRVLRRARVVRIADLVDGQLACIVGVVERDGASLEALVSRKACIAFDTTVQVFRGADFTIPARVDAAEAALCNRPIAKSERFEERILEEGATVRLVGSVSLDPTVTAKGE